jgi:hypothetical protein
VRNSIVKPDDDFGVIFYRLPLVLLQNDLYKKLKPSRKIAYAILQDRLDISKKNGLQEKNGDIFFFFSNPGLKEHLNFSDSTITSIIKDLSNAILLKCTETGRANKYNLYYPSLTIEDIVRIKSSEKLSSKNLDEEMNMFIKTRKHKLKNIKDNYMEKYIKIPKVFIKDKKYMDLSNEAKIMYGLFLDKLSFSLVDSKYDEKGDYYIALKMCEIANLLGVSIKSAAKYKEELKKANLLEEVQTGRASIFYIYYPDVSEEEFYYMKKGQNNAENKRKKDSPDTKKSNARNENLLKKKRKYHGSEAKKIDISNTPLFEILKNNTQINNHHDFQHALEEVIGIFLNNNPNKDDGVFLPFIFENLTSLVQQIDIEKFSEIDILELVQFVIEYGKELDYEIIEHFIQNYLKIGQFENTNIAIKVKFELILFLTNEKIFDEDMIIHLVNTVERFPPTTTFYHNYYKTVFSNALDNGAHKAARLKNKRLSDERNKKPNGALTEEEKVDIDTVDYYRNNSIEYFFEKYGVIPQKRDILFLDNLNSKIKDKDIAKVFVDFILKKEGNFDLYSANEFQQMFLQSDIKKAIGFMESGILSTEETLIQELEIHRLLHDNEFDLEGMEKLKILEQQLTKIKEEKAKFY